MLPYALPIFAYVGTHWHTDCAVAIIMILSVLIAWCGCDSMTWEIAWCQRSSPALQYHTVTSTFATTRRTRRAGAQTAARQKSQPFNWSLLTSRGRPVTPNMRSAWPTFTYSLTRCPPVVENREDVMENDYKVMDFYHYLHKLLSIIVKRVLHYVLNDRQQWTPGNDFQQC